MLYMCKCHVIYDTHGQVMGLECHVLAKCNECTCRVYQSHKAWVYFIIFKTNLVLIIAQYLFVAFYHLKWLSFVSIKY